jgi:transcriptional regulator with XRE-family HTH domain
VLNEKTFENSSLADMLAIQESVDNPQGGRKSLGEILKTARTMKGYSLRGLAGKVGCAHSLIADLEAGSRSVSTELLLKICEILELNDITILYFTGRLFPDVQKTIAGNLGMYIFVNAFVRGTQDGLLTQEIANEVYEATGRIIESIKREVIKKEQERESSSGFNRN